MPIKKGTINIPNVTGNIVITASAVKMSSGGYSTTSVPCTNISVIPSVYTFSKIGQQYILKATPTPSNTTDTIVWHSNNPAVAKVSNGVVTANANGNCTITVTCGSQSATIAVTVNDVNVGVTLTDFNLDKSLTITSEEAEQYGY